MIDGIGIDVVDIARFQESLERTPSLREKLFTESERDKPVQSLAARFAAKEALYKALSPEHGLHWQISSSAARLQISLMAHLCTFHFHTMLESPQRWW
jgi:phosphopantetheine--protein transferase-like protein